MYLKNISARNFKIGTFDQTLTPITVICGPNETGKSSRAEAAILSVAKFIPGYPVGSRALFDAFATGNPMVVDSRTDTGLAFIGKWTEKSGKVSYEGSEEPLVPAVMADAGEFLNLSGPDRTRFMFSRAQLGPQFTVDALTHTITANIKNIKLDEATPQTEAVIGELLEKVLATSKRLAAETPQNYIAALAIMLKDDLKVANQNVQRQEKTVQGLTQNRESDAVAPDTEPKLFKARQELEKANAEVARIKSELAAVRRQLDDAETKRVLLLGDAPARERKVILESEIEKLKLLPTERINTSTYGTAAAKAAIAHSVNVRASDQAGDLVKRLEKEKADVAAMDCCPTCGADLKAKKEKLLIELDQQTTEAVLANEKADEQFNLTAETLHQAEKELENALAIADANATNLAALNKASEELASINKRLEQSAVASAEVAKIPALTETATKLTADYQSAAAASIVAKTAVDALDADHRKLLGIRAEAKASAVAQEEAAKKKAEAGVLKQSAAMLEELQSLIIEQSIGPIIANCNELCAGILKYPLAFKDGEIGMIGGNGFYGIKTFSDSQKLLSYAALSLALAADAEFKFAVIGRFESFDKSKRDQIIQRCLDLVRAGKLHQVLLIEVNKEPDYKCFEAEPEFSLSVLV